jgi:hypothetical protein
VVGCFKPNSANRQTLLTALPGRQRISRISRINEPIVQAQKTLGWEFLRNPTPEHLEMRFLTPASAHNNRAPTMHTDRCFANPPSPTMFMT